MLDAEPVWATAVVVVVVVVAGSAVEADGCVLGSEGRFDVGVTETRSGGAA